MTRVETSKTEVVVGEVCVWERGSRSNPERLIRGVNCNYKSLSRKN